MSHPIYDQKVNRLNGESNDLSEYKGQVLLIVNTASECGFTPQYEGLESLYQQYKNKGFSVLGFPCNQFGKQEPGSSDEIASFCSNRFSVSFPLFEKVDVNGENAHPLFDHLKKQAPGILGSQSIKWNFTKFLVDTEGNVVKRFAPKDKPEAIEKTVAKLV
jgi:glutathione peroxidase